MSRRDALLVPALLPATVAARASWIAVDVFKSAKCGWRWEWLEPTEIRVRVTNGTETDSMRHDLVCPIATEAGIPRTLKSMSPTATCRRVTWAVA